jgi:predicted TIM-barrel fold metal-dependent hydrolase
VSGQAVDWHAHWVPPALQAALRERTQVPRIVREADGGERLVMPIGTLTFDASFGDIEQRLMGMDALGVERQVLSLPGLFGLDSLPANESGPLLRRFNDDLAALCRTHPGRFSGLAALPLADPGQALREFERARTELGLLGAILPVDGFLTEPAAASMRPLLARGQALGAHFFVHPGRMPGSGPAPAEPTDHALARRALAVQAEVGEAMVTLLMSDLLDACPDVTVQVANLGGTFAAVVERMDHMVALRTPGAPLPSARTRRVWVDCASLGATALEQAVAVFGAERVLVGTDCPIFDTARTLEAVHGARLDGTQRRAILHGNAYSLLARLAAPRLHA